MHEHLNIFKSLFKRREDIYATVGKGRMVEALLNTIKKEDCFIGYGILLSDGKSINDDNR